MHNNAYMNMREEIEKFTNVFKVLSDSSRLRIILVLIKAGCELCVCEIADSLLVSQYNISRHLKELKYSGLLIERKQGRWVHYRINDDLDTFHESLIRSLSCLPKEPFSEDEIRLEKRLAMRKEGQCVVGFQSDLREKIFTQ